MYGEGNRGGGFQPRGGPGGFAPVQVGEELDVRIEAVGEKGDGIARKRGFVLFVPNTREGDEVRIKITKVLRKVGFADVVGQAQSTPAAEEAPRSPRPPRREEAPMARPLPPEPSPEDTEDFGEEPEEEPAPAEPETPEEPAPEAPPEPPEAPSDEDMDAPPLPGDEKKEE